MSMKDSDEVVFYNALTYFPSEEWVLLKEWQKELYKTVMKEIHQALISLGPLIASTVCTLRAKENEELYSMNSLSPERRHKGRNSPREVFSDPDDVYSINEEPPHPNKPQDTERSKRNDDLHEGFPYSTSGRHLTNEEKPVSIFIDHLGAEIREGSADLSSEYEVSSFSIKDETEECFMEYEEDPRMESTYHRTGNASKKKRTKIEDPMKPLEKPTSCKAFLGKRHTKLFQNTHKKKESTNEVWSECYPEPKGEQPDQCESTFSNPVHYSLDQTSSSTQTTNNSGNCEISPGNSQFLKDIPNTQDQNPKILTVAECDKSLDQKGGCSWQMRTHSRERPYACTECDKKFFEKSHLLTHSRTHSGEKPYTCALCHKRFNRKDNLNVHLRIHTGETPYKCRKCEKNFRRKSDLMDHQGQYAH